MSGLVEVDVIGAAQADVGGTEVPGVEAVTRASGFLNGTFAIPGLGPVHVSGSFSSDSTEVWEAQDGLATRSNSTSSYVMTVTVGLPFSVQAQVWVNATTSYAALPPVNLSVGESASAPFATNLSMVTSASGLGFTTHNETQADAVGAWTRQVLAAENVTVEAGTFSSYRLNQSLGSFPGLGVVVPTGGANETAWFSNDVGYYVKRQAYVNGTPVAEMRLKSYTYPAAPPGPSLAEVTVFLAIPVAVVAALVLLFLRRKRKARPQTVTTGTAGPVGELPPKPPGSGP